MCGVVSLAWNTADFVYPKDVCFECTRCAVCCGDTRNRKRRVFMLGEEAHAVAVAAGKPVEAFAVTIENQAPYVYEIRKKRGRCPFLHGVDCTIYAARPLVCRFYPFELTTVDGRHVFHCTRECPGIGKGPRLRSEYFLRLLREAYRRLGNLDSGS